MLHRSDSGGFFVALLKKTLLPAQPLPKWPRIRLSEGLAARPRAAAAATAEWGGNDGADGADGAAGAAGAQHTYQPIAPALSMRLADDLTSG